MAFTLPSDLSTSWVDESSTITAADWNNIAGMGNAIKAAIGTFGYNTVAKTVATSETTTSTSYTDLTTTTDQVTVAIGSSGMALVMIYSTIDINTSGVPVASVSYAMSGANTVAATDTKALILPRQYVNALGNLSAAFLETGLTPGITTFKLKYKVSNATYAPAFANRRIAVIPFPSTDGTHAAGTINLDASSAVALGVTGVGYNRPTFDAVGAGQATSSGTVTWQQVVGADAKALVVYLNPQGYGFSTSTPPPHTVTINGAALTYLGAAYCYNAGGGYQDWLLAYGMLNPPVGTKTITAVTDGQTSFMAGNSVTYNNVASFGAVQTHHTSGAAASANPSITVSGATPEHVVSAAICGYTQAFSAFTPTQRSIINYQASVNMSLGIGDSNGPANVLGCTAASSSWAGLSVIVSST